VQLLKSLTQSYSSLNPKIFTWNVMRDARLSESGRYRRAARFHSLEDFA
jgi:hypothetical protein